MIDIFKWNVYEMLVGIWLSPVLADVAACGAAAWRRLILPLCNVMLYIYETVIDVFEDRNNFQFRCTIYFGHLERGQFTC